MNKVTKEAIKAKIKNVSYHRLGAKTTICVITMENGFEVMGESSCVDPKNFDIQIGREVSYENAFEKLWPLEGYLLQEKLHLKKNGTAVQKAIFQYPLVPEECHKVFSQGTSYEQKVEHKACNCMDWEKSPQIKKLMFDQMFPDAPKGAFGFADGKVIREEKPFDWTYWNGMLEDPNFKEIAFYKMFPGVSKADFETLEKRREIKDELSFMEKYSKLYEEFPKFEGNHDPFDRINAEKELEIKIDKLIRQETDIIIQALKGSARKSPDRSTAIRKFTEGVMWLGMDMKALGGTNPYPESRNPANATVEPTADGLKL